MRAEQFTTIRSEGGLLPADLLSRVAALDTSLEAIGPAAYHLAPTERIGEAITRSWNRLVGAWSVFRSELAELPAGDAATGLTRSRWLLLLFQELGYGQLQPARTATELSSKSYAISHFWGASPIHLVGAGLDLDRRAPGVAGAAGGSPHGIMQEFLNRSDDHLWGFVSNGLRLRVLRDNAALTRQAYLEFDLEAMFEGQVYADFAVLWLVCHQSRVEGELPEKCVLERWMVDAAERGTRALDQLRVGVERAIATLGSGFLQHPANGELRARLRSGELATLEYQRQLLRLVYRILFLLVAEARELLAVPDSSATAVERYRRYYSVARLRSLADTTRGGPHGDLWAGLRVVFVALGQPAGLPNLALPALGSFLWSDTACPDLDVADVANRSLLAAMRDLSSVSEGRVRRAVDYRNLGAEELGSIYEALLELHPRLDIGSSQFELTTAAGHERKTTGSYYTPTSLVNELLDSALDPVLDEAAASEDPEAAILSLTVLDPACGSGHFLIAAAHRIARRLAGVRTGEEEPGPVEVRRALRDVVGRCLYGIDVNPMAVELCKVSLWMEAMEPGRPLSFLEHHVVCGNSLLGTTPRLLAEGVPDDAFKPLTGDDKQVTNAWKKANRRERKEREQLSFDLVSSVGRLVEPLAGELHSIEADADYSLDRIARKEERWRELVSSDAAERARLPADAWCAAFVAPKVKGAPVITDAVVRKIADDPALVDPSILDVVRGLAEEYAFLHPHVTFPQVFSVPADDGEPDNPETGWSGGFSVVLGNPPWDKVEFKEQEWFAARVPEIASMAGAARKRAIAKLANDHTELHASYEEAVRHLDGVRSLLGASGRYPLCGRGRINTYAVFAESMRSYLGPISRMGVIVPTGIATDDSTKLYFADLVAKGSLVRLFDFENAAPLFPEVHRSYKFCLLTVSGLARPHDEAEFCFFAHSVADLADPERRFTLSPEDFRLLNPNTRTCPVFRTRRDAEITKGIYRRVPVLIEEGPPARNPWGVSFKQGLFNMTSDSHLFRTREELESDGWVLRGNVFERGGERYLPLYEAKMIHHFNHRWASYDTDDIGPEQLADPAFVVQPRYWVPEDAVLGQATGSWLLAFRNVCRSTDERTLIASAIPVVGVGHSAPLIEAHRPEQLLAALGSFALDYVVRQKLGGANLTFGYFSQLPVPALSVSSEGWIGLRVVELTCTAWDVRSIGTPTGADEAPYIWMDSRRPLLRAELDACFFHLYGINRDDVDYIVDTFPIVKRKDEQRYGEYRTKRLILEVYDAMAKAIETGEPYETILDPPPADPSLAHPESTRPDWAR